MRERKQAQPKALGGSVYSAGAAYEGSRELELRPSRYDGTVLFVLPCAHLTYAHHAPLCQALATMQRGDVCIVFTPDDTHFGIASAAIAAGLHVLMAKPLVKTLEQHQALVAQAEEQQVLVRLHMWVNKRLGVSPPVV